MSRLRVAWLLICWAGCSRPSGSVADDAAGGPDAAVSDAGIADAGTTDASGPDAYVPFCGDGVIQGTEECDGHDFGERSCQTEGRYEGSLVCTDRCSVDTSGCSGYCGDGVVNGPETCESAVPLAGSCRSHGFLSGTPVSCRADCVLNGCTNLVILHTLGFPPDVALHPPQSSEHSFDRFGDSVAFAGDIDGDGLKDLLIAAPGENAGNGAVGAVYLLYGSSDGSATLDHAARFVDRSYSSFILFPIPVSRAGDLDQDGRDDFLIMFPNRKAYLVYGQHDRFTGTIELSDLVAGGQAAVFDLSSLGTCGSEFPCFGGVLAIPDVTGDHHPDLLLHAENMLDHTGVVFVVPGKAGRYSGVITMASPASPLPSTVYAAFVSSAPGDLLGGPLAVGDLDGDGAPDFAISSLAGLHIFYGPITGIRSVADADAHTSNGAFDSVTIGDIDGDDHEDLIVGTHPSDAGGSAFVLRGGPMRFPANLTLSESDLEIPASAFGSSYRVKTDADLDGDHHNDVIISDLASGTVSIVSGSLPGTGSVDLFRQQRWSVFNSEFSELDSGHLQVDAADFNGDGFADLAIGVSADMFGDAGGVYLLTGAGKPHAAQ